MVEEEGRIQTLKAQFEREFEEKDSEIKRTWEDLGAWGKICGDIDRSADKITEQFLNRPAIDPTFFTSLCQHWTELLRKSRPAQRKTIINHNGFRYSLAIMLIHAQRVFPGGLSPLKNLWELFGESLEEERENFVCDFGNFGNMKETGIKIMKSAKSYNLAYVYLGSEVENEEED
jgi:hypothetical protein